MCSCVFGAYGAWSGVDAPKASIPKDYEGEGFVYRTRQQVIVDYAIGGVIGGAIFGAVAGSMIACRRLSVTA
ncbi:MAG: hypothetical protein U0805_15705 [Pirellulales bacterium]